MPKKMSKAQGRKRLKEIMGKSRMLFLAGYISTKDFDSIGRICLMREKQLK